MAVRRPRRVDFGYGIDHNEMLEVLRGGCRFDEGDGDPDASPRGLESSGELDESVGELGPDDTIVIPAYTRYGFTCGPEGMEFLTIRAGQATVALDG